MTRHVVPSFLLLAALLSAASWWAYSMSDPAGPERAFSRYDPSGGPLTIGGLHIGMTYAQVVRAAGREPVELEDGGYLVPGPVRLDFEIPRGAPAEISPPARELDRVGWLCGDEVTQDGRLLLRTSRLLDEGSDVTIADALRVFGPPTKVRSGTYRVLYEGKEFQQRDGHRDLGFCLGGQMLSLTIDQDRWFGAVVNSISLRAGTDSEPDTAAPLFRLRGRQD